MNDLKITLIQSELHWENKEKNLEMFSQKISAIKQSTDIIVLPEMFSTGFTMLSNQFAETMDGQTVQWMRSKAMEQNCIVTGSFVCEDNGCLYNRLVWMQPNGTCRYYDKRHLFRMANENNHYSAGDTKIIVEVKGWKICPLICYDLRFPVWSRQELEVRRQKTEVVDNLYQYDVLVYVANWPERRSHAWKTLLMARAIENQCYVVGVNRVGNDGNQMYHSGDSAVINAKGEKISNTNASEQSVETVSLSYDELSNFRKSFPAILDADDFEVW